MFASIVSIQRSNSVFVVLLFLQHFFSSTRVQKEGAVDPNTVLSPNFAKIKGISSVLCAAYWWSLKKTKCLGMSPLPRHKHSQPRISASFCQCLLPQQCPLPTCSPLWVLQEEHVPQVPSPCLVQGVLLNLCWTWVIIL